MPPSEVNEKNQSQVWVNLHKKKSQQQTVASEKLTIKVGDWVRISNLKTTFSREYNERWSNEQFLVVAASLKQGKPAYILQDFLGDSISGSFYSYELQPITIPKNVVYRVEKILKRRKLKNKPREVLVKWMNWGEKFNSWILESDLEKISKPPE